MNDRTEFDDLARRKLEEREFPFDPQGWADMERQLDAAGSAAEKRPDRRWMLAALLLLGTCGGVWYGIASRRQNASADGLTTATVPQDKAEPATTASEIAGSTPNTPAPATDTPKTTGLGPEHVQYGTSRPSSSSQDPSPAVRPDRERALPPEKTTPSKAKMPDTRTAPPPPDVPIATVPPAPEDERPTINDHALPTTDTPADVPPVVVIHDPTAADMTDSELPTVRNDEGQTFGTDPARTGPVDHVHVPIDSSIITPAMIVTGAPPATPSTQTSDMPSMPDSTLTASPIVPTTTDSSLTSTAPDSLLPPLPLYPHWEITAWGGLFNTFTRYTGARTEGWAASNTARQTMGFGAELMHMGTHFGMGTGLHFSTYAEQLDAEELSDTQTHLVYIHDLQSIDTSIMVVNGTVWINGQQYYATYMQDTTFLVLVTTTSEETLSTVRRNALARSNRTSYLEIPLLFDAHTGKGPWSFGVRGGPTLGVLQGRRGVLPGTMGYTDLADEAFQELVLGWTAQGYLRYRFADTWSVGVGPAARGQLLNSMQGDALVRRSTAWGGQFSVTYQLR